MTLLRWIHRLSWLALLASILWMVVLPGYPGSGLVVAAAFHYVLVYALGVGVARLCGYGRPAAPMVLPPPTAPVVMRRVILEEITPDDRQRRIVLQDIPPSDERTHHAR